MSPELLSASFESSPTPRGAGSDAESGEETINPLYHADAGLEGDHPWSGRSRMKIQGLWVESCPYEAPPPLPALSVRDRALSLACTEDEAGWPAAAPQETPRAQEPSLAAQGRVSSPLFTNSLFALFITPLEDPTLLSIDVQTSKLTTVFVPGPDCFGSTPLSVWRQDEPQSDLSPRTREARASSALAAELEPETSQPGLDLVRIDRCTAAFHTPDEGGFFQQLLAGLPPDAAGADESEDEPLSDYGSLPEPRVINAALPAFSDYGPNMLFAFRIGHEYIDWYARLVSLPDEAAIAATKQAVYADLQGIYSRQEPASV